MGKTKNVVMSGEAATTKVDKYAAKKEEAKIEAKKQPKHGKNILSMRGKIDKNRTYSIPEAIALIKDTSFVKFDATIEFHCSIRKESLSVQATLPFTAGRTKKVEFATDETIKKLEEGKIEFDILLSTAEMMPKLVKFAKLLGPRGMMPNPKNGTLVKDEKAVEKFSTNAITIKTEKGASVIHLAVGKVSMEEKEIVANLEAAINAINPKQITKAYLSSTMGPSVKVSAN